MSADPSRAYVGVAATWDDGPSRVYDVLARAVVSAYPGDIAGLRVLDIGAGTGAVSRALAERRAVSTAIDLAPDMVARLRDQGFTAVVGDIRSLPFDDAAFDGAVAAFAISHVDDPRRALAEACRVVRSEGVILVGAFATQRTNASKQVVDAVAEGFGFVAPDWYRRFKKELEPMCGASPALEACARGAGIAGIHVEERVVETGVSEPSDIVASRLGMAHLAPFVASLPSDRRQEFIAAAVDAVALDPQPIRPTILILTGRRP
ncbi:MAG TPA: class I SAM-dependent methyltransferase [Candidatus Acidoferrales bacterium]|nr:class I SAM-dependent methyltransferase [Candidatus Acidoferrales bacterium]